MQSEPHSGTNEQNAGGAEEHKGIKMSKDPPRRGRQVKFAM